MFRRYQPSTLPTRRSRRLGRVDSVIDCGDHPASPPGGASITRWPGTLWSRSGGDAGQRRRAAAVDRRPGVGIRLGQVG